MAGNTDWWLELMEPGDPLWFNYPDSSDKPFRFVGRVPEGEPRAGQAIFDEWLPPDDGAPKGLFTRLGTGGGPEGKWVRKVGWCLLPVPLGSEPWKECQAGGWKGTREELVAAWRSLGADVPPAHWLNRELAKVSDA
jgi:hypothetical protein